MKQRHPSIGALVLLTAVGAAACGGTSSTLARANLPADELSLLELAPSDAFVVARLDMRELRASSSWELVDARLEAASEEERSIANGTDRAYFAVGGLIDAPPTPPMYNENGEYQRRPDWVGLAETFGGRIPAGVAIVEGRVASVCRALVERAETHGESHGYTYGIKDGTVVAVRGDSFCAVTFEPTWQHLLDDATTPSPTLRRLAAVANGGSLGAASMAFELDAPSFRAMIEGIGPDPAREGSDSEQWAPIARRIAQILMDGIAAAEWEVRSTAGGFESVGRLQVTDVDRGIMWREFTSMYLQILDVVMTNPTIPENVRDRYREVFSEVRVEALPDGYLVRSSVSAATVARLFDDLPNSGAAPAVDVATSAPASAVLQLPYELEGDAASTIAAVEPQLANLDQLDARERGDVLTALARSYRFVGRFDDARTLLRSSAEAAGNAGTVVAPTMYAELCALELEVGRAAEAKAAAADGVDACGGTYCGELESTLRGCEAIAMAAGGDVSGALAKVSRGNEPSDDASAIRFSVARARVLMIAGRLAEAATTVANVCLGRSHLDPCQEAAVLDAQLVARTSTVAADMESALLGLESRIGNVHGLRATTEASIAFESSRCDARSRIAGTEESTQASCADVYARAVEAYGETHPRTVAAGIGLARTARARRDTTTATATLAKVDRALGALGPNVPERADRTSLGGRAPRGR